MLGFIASIATIHGKEYVKIAILEFELVYYK
jgi:hypothetical protein